MPDLILNAGPPHEKQMELRSLLFDRRDATSGDTVWTAHGVAGRGGGKTKNAVFLLCESGLVINPGRPHYYSAPTNDDLRRIFIRTWEQTVPRWLYKLNKVDKTIILLPTGTVIDLISRQSTTGSRNYDPAKGKEWAGGIDDELPQDTGPDGWNDLHLCIRDPRAARRWHASISTPKIGWYKNLVMDGDDPHVHWTSWDNPYLPEGWADAQAARLDQQTADEQLRGLWVAKTGLCWPSWSDEDWPAGNIHHAAFDKTRPFYLGIDLGGGSSAYQIVQQHIAANAFGQRAYNGAVDVVVAEWTPNRKGLDKVLPEVQERYGVPQVVVVGQDVTHPGALSAEKPEMFIRQFWGPGVQIMTPTGDVFHKDVQGRILRSMILNTAGERRFCVSKHLESHDGKSRGILNVMREDVWPAVGVKDFFLKDKRTAGGRALEDARDCALYLMACMHSELAQYQPLTKFAA